MQLPAHSYLEGLAIPYENLEFLPEIEKGAASVARVLGYNPSQIVKTLIFESGYQER